MMMMMCHKATTLESVELLLLLP